MSSIARIEMPSGNPVPRALQPMFQTLGAPDIPPQVFIVDRPAHQEQAVEPLIRAHGWPSEVFGSVQEFLTTPFALVPSCLILNVSQPADHLEFQKRIAAERPIMPIIHIATTGDVRMAVQIIKAGAMDLLTRPFADELLFGAIQQALEHSRAALTRHLELRSLKERFSRLTCRERQVMTLVTSGKPNKEVAMDLGITEITVKAHRGRVMQKMRSDSLAQLVTMAAKLRLSLGQVYSSELDRKHFAAA